MELDCFFYLFELIELINFFWEVYVTSHVEEHPKMLI